VKEAVRWALVHNVQRNLCVFLGGTFWFWIWLGSRRCSWWCARSLILLRGLSLNGRGQLGPSGRPLRLCVLPAPPSLRRGISAGGRAALALENHEQRCALFYDTVRAPRGWDRILLGKKKHV